MPKAVIGWDVGGAHLKAALLNVHGQIQQVIQVPCALWRGLDQLQQAIKVVLQSFAIQQRVQPLHAITMTGELVDLFSNRQQGVHVISQMMQTQLTGEKYFYTGAKTADFSGFVTFEQIQAHWLSIASANWLATAAMTAQWLKHNGKFSSGILIDIGSTTTDFVRLKNHRPQCGALTDAGRMQTDELVYTGVVRTPLMALTQKIRFQQQLTSIAAEHFATTADVYRLTGELNSADDMAETADGQDKTVLASYRRLARMIGRDVEEADSDTWLALAHAFKTKQLDRLAEVLEIHLSLFNDRDQPTVLLGAGAGHFLVETLAKRFDLPYRNAAIGLHEVTHSAPEQHLKTSTCLPAAAVAYLAFEQYVRGHAALGIT